MPEHFPFLISGLVIAFVGLFLIIKISKVLLKLGVFIAILVILAILFHDKIPL